MAEQNSMTTAVLAEEVRSLMQAHWRPDHGYSVPNPGTYPHLWLWDSCFHAIIWGRLGDDRALHELEAVLTGQLANGEGSGIILEAFKQGTEPRLTSSAPSVGLFGNVPVERDDSADAAPVQGVLDGGAPLAPEDYNGLTPPPGGIPGAANDNAPQGGEGS